MRRYLLLSSFLLASVLRGQEYRATLAGVITDQTGAAIPGADVTATNVATGVAAKSQTNAAGSYVVPYLLPGPYTIRAGRAGFKTFERSNLELRVNDRTRLDITLEVGDISQQVTVTAEAPLVELSSGSRGQVIDHRQITDLPLAGKNPFMLMGLAAGVQFAGSLQYARPFDLNSASNFSINGGRLSLNEYQIDGVPDNVITTVSTNVNMPIQSARVGYVPPVEATQEFKIQSATYDAQYGRTSGGIVSVSVKPGTNDLHGAVYEYLRRTRFEANSFANNAANKPRSRRVADQYGFEIDGPVVKNRAFFMLAFEKFRESVPSPTVGTLPAAAQRQGDFSQTFTSSGALYTIYDPLTIRANPAYNPARATSLSNLRFLRTPFRDNRVPQDRMDPVALRILQDIPLPNQAGSGPARVNNWYGDVSQDDAFQNFIGRVDHQLTSAWKMYARWSHNFRDGGRIDYWGWNTPATRRIHGARRNDGAVFDVVGTLDARTVFSARGGWNRFEEYSVFTPQDISGLGFPSSLAAQLQIPNKYPQITFENYMQTGIDEWDYAANDTYSTQASLLKIAGPHSFKFGAEFRLMHNARLGRANASGTYQFTRGWTSSNPEVNDPQAGNAIASFLLGTMNRGTAQLNATPYLSWKYPVLFFQDDWQAGRRLTLNLGLRWDYETAPVERYNRQNRGFDPSIPSPYQVPGFDLHGGLVFAGVDGQQRGAFNPDRNNIQPRFGLAYKVFDSRPLVVRAGFGRYYLPTVDYGGLTGFTQVTTAQAGTPDFLPLDRLSNPFPNGLVQPPGATLGAATQVGDAAIFNDPRRPVPQMWQFSAGFQYELLTGLLVDASYVGSRTDQLGVTQQWSYLTPDQLALGTAYLGAVVPNPFYNVLPRSSSRGAQPAISRRALLLQYPQYTGVAANNVGIGESWYNSLQLKIERRLKQGLSLLASCTLSKTMETTQYKNGGDPQLSRELATFDVPRRFVLSGLYEFPIGPRKRWISSGLASRIVGGWQLSWNGIVQSGPPMPLPDYYINGDPRLSSGQTLGRWFNTSRDLWTARPPDTLRVAPFRSPNIPRHTAPQLDLGLLRDFRIRERHTLQLKASAYNATNTPVFDFPNNTPDSPLFGVVPSTQINMPRSVELGVRYVF